MGEGVEPSFVTTTLRHRFRLRVVTVALSCVYQFRHPIILKNYSLPILATTSIQNHFRSLTLALSIIVFVFYSVKGIANGEVTNGYCYYD
jgi:hypothetical protein